MSIRQRLIDWRREHRIKRLARVEIRLFDAGLKREAHMIDLMRCAHIRGRSAQQIARMERKQGLRP